MDKDIFDGEDNISVSDAIRPYQEEINADLSAEAAATPIKSPINMQMDIIVTNGKKPSYSLEEQLLVVEMVRKNGGVVNKQIVRQAQIMLRSKTVGDVSVRKWWNKYKDQPPAEIVKKAYGDWVTPKEMIQRGIDPKVASMREEAANAYSKSFEAIVEAYTKRAVDPDAIAATKGRDAVWAAAVAIDKIRLLNSVPKEIVDILPSIIDLIRKKGRAPEDVFKEFYAWLLRMPDAI